MDLYGAADALNLDPIAGIQALDDDSLRALGEYGVTSVSVLVRRRTRNRVVVCITIYSWPVEWPLP